MAANDGANGSTLTWAGTTQAVTSISFTEAGNEVDVTHMGSSTHVYVIGIPDSECTCELVGASTAAVGDAGALAIAWNDTGTDAIAAAIVTNVEVSGALDGAITSSLTFKPAG